MTSSIFKDDKLLSSDFKVDWISVLVKAGNLTISLCTPDDILNDDSDGGGAGDDDDGDVVDEAGSGGGVDVTGDKDGCDETDNDTDRICECDDDNDPGKNDVDDSNGNCEARWDVETDW